MNAELLQSNWAPIVASVVGIIIVLLAVLRIAGSSARGQLRRARKKLAAERAILQRANAVVAKAERQAGKLQQHANHVKPRLVQESKEALEDAKALAKIANDKVLIAENHVRRVILEEFPPSKHQRLRAKCLPETAPDKRPFSF